MQLHVITESCVDPKGLRPENAISSGLWSATKIITDITIFVYQISASDSILGWLTGIVAKFIILLRDGIWRPLLPTITILGAISLGYWGLIKKQLILTVESAVWMVLATALGFWVLGDPASFMRFASHATNMGTATINATVGETMFQANRCPQDGLSRIPFQDTNSPEHYGPTGDGGHDRDFNDGHLWEDPVWTNSAMIYDSLLCQPWIMAVFGGGQNENEAAHLYADQAIRSSAFSRADLAQIRTDRGGDESDEEIYRRYYDRSLESKSQQYQAVTEQIYHFYPESYGAWSGHDTAHRLQAAGTAAVGAVLGGLLIFIVSGAVIVHKIMFLFLLLASPVVLLFGIHPGFGRILVHRYFEALVGILVMQLMVQLVQTIFLSLYGVLAGSTMHWSVKIALMFLIYVAAFIFRKKIAAALASIGGGAFARIMNKSANDKTLGRVAMAIPGVAAYKVDRKIREKASPLVGQLAGTALGGPIGGHIGKTLGEKNAARLRGDKKRTPDQAPPMPVPNLRGGGGYAPRPGRSGTWGGSGGGWAPPSPPAGGTSGGGGGGRWSAQDVTPPRPSPPSSKALPPGPAGGSAGGGGSTPPPTPPPAPAPALPSSSGPGGSGGAAATPPTRAPSTAPALLGAPQGQRVVSEGQSMIVHRPQAANPTPPAPAPVRAQVRILPRTPGG
ncbi:hypothetical protein [Nocardiopsis sp. NPDC006938]|uniref:hypothetical protein n=1 Tax=Nocardiopsis sp. NPDC006938 TaxID=3364337 RepID=UPI00369912C1